MRYAITFILITFLIIASFYMYYHTWIFYVFAAMKRGLDKHLTLTLWSLVKAKKLKPPSKIFKKEETLAGVLKERFRAIEEDPVLSENEKQNLILDLYKIRQVVDLGDHASLHIESTKDIPVFHEIFILWKKVRIKAKVVVNEKKHFALVIAVPLQNSDVYAHLFSVETGTFFDVSFSAGVKEEYRFSTQVLELVAVDRKHFYVSLTHTPNVNAVFRHRYRQKDVYIEDVSLKLVENTGTDVTSNPQGDDLQRCFIISLTMASCILKLQKHCRQGLHVAISFKVGDEQLLYYGRIGLMQAQKDTEEDDQDGYLVEVQFTQSTKSALLYLGETVYEFRGS